VMVGANGCIDFDRRAFEKQPAKKPVSKAGPESRCLRQNQRGRTLKTIYLD
jgi:hypothetical protein